jgi:hypothetical protein
MKYFSLPWFTFVFSLSYIFIFARDLPLFLYYPLIKEFHLSAVSGAGPAMKWYGLLASTGIVSLIAAMVLRDRWIPAVLQQKFWLAPFVAMLAVAWQLRFFVA